MEVDRELSQETRKSLHIDRSAKGPSWACSLCGTENNATDAVSCYLCFKKKTTNRNAKKKKKKQSTLNFGFRSGSQDSESKSEFSQDSVGPPEQFEGIAKEFPSMLEAIREFVIAFDVSVST